MADLKAMQAEYKKLAKKADRQLRALESLAGQEHYKGVLKYAYARAERDIAAFDKFSGQTYEKPRFSRNIPNDVRQLQARIIDVNNFLESKTNTKKKITDVYRQRTKTVNEKFGTNFKWQDLARYYESNVAEINDSKYGSNQIVMALGEFIKYKKPDDILEKIAKNEKFTDDEVMDEIIKHLAKDGLTLDTLFGGN